MEEAISQLQDLGVNRTQAKKALARYNNDVVRAADFIFSGNCISDDDEEEKLVQKEKKSEALAISLSLEEERQRKIEQTATTSHSTANDQSNLSVVLYKDPQETFDQTVPKNNENIKSLTGDSSLTWWIHPENPSDRKATDNLPIGLRPPAYYFNYAPVIIQAMFHVTYFQSAVASYRPVPASWGSPNNYWKGQGESIPGYTVIEKVNLKTSEESSDNEAEVENYNDIDERCIENEFAEGSHQEGVETEVKAIPKCLQSFRELQKIFGFLGNTKRGYGSISDYTKSLNTRAGYWDEDDLQCETFLDLFIGNLVECDQLSEIPPSIQQDFKSMFLMKAKIEYGDDYEEEELCYLTISPEKGAVSFYECLDPLVFESYKLDDDNDRTYKFTSFEKTSPILFVVLENRSKLKYDYRIDTTIYLDRYLHANKDKATRGFQKMQSYQKDIRNSQEEINKLRGDIHNMSKRDILDQSIHYFKEKKGIQKDDSDVLEYILESVKQKITMRLEQKEALLEERKKEVYDIFDKEDMKNKPYGLRATFHHDGKTGTGHYWAYIWVEAKEESPLMDVKTEEGWFKFCDAQVTPAKEEDIFNDPVPPFSLMYVDDSLPKYTKQQIFENTPNELKEFIEKDNALFELEILNHENRSSLSQPVYEGDWFTEKTEEYQIEHTSLQDTNSIKTAVGQTNSEFEINDTQKALGQGFTKLKDQTNIKIVEAAGYTCDDYRLLMNFETFLARTQNQQGLEHLYLLYLKESDENGDRSVNEEASKDDENLKSAWNQYECFLSLGEKVTQALSYFVKQEYQMALQILSSTKRAEIAWKTQVMMNLDMCAYSNTDTISFNPIYETYGKKCLEILNKTAFNKALNVSYRSRGLEDALHIAHQAHTIIGPDAISNDSTYESLRELWLNFGEQDNSDKLTDSQTDLLNTLVMTYLEGQSGSDVDDLDKVEYPALEDDDVPRSIPLWVKYKQVCSEAEQDLKQILL